MKGRARLRQTPNEGLSGPDTVERQAAQPQSGGRGGAKQRGDHEPERKCVLSGAHGARDALIRLALGPDGKVAPDVRARAAGRGAWIGVDRARLEEAQAKGRLKGALARAFKTGELIIADDLGARIEAALRQALLDRQREDRDCGPARRCSSSAPRRRRRRRWFGQARSSAAHGWAN
jgi:predicted RNA-binding protein YlxR (DUF448 family)